MRWLDVFYKPNILAMLKIEEALRKYPFLSLFMGYSVFTGFMAGVTLADPIPDGVSSLLGVG